MAAVAVQQRLKRGAFLLQGAAFGGQFQLFQAAQRPQAHVQDRLGLHFGQPALPAGRRAIVLFGHRPWVRLCPILGHQGGLGVIVVADDVDHPVKVQESGEEALQHLQPGVDPFHPVAAAAL